MGGMYFAGARNLGQSCEVQATFHISGCGKPRTSIEYWTFGPLMRIGHIHYPGHGTLDVLPVYPKGKERGWPIIATFLGMVTALAG